MLIFKTIFNFSWILLLPGLLLSRSLLRKPDPLTPIITTQWKNGTKKYKLRDSHLEITPLFHLYDEKHVQEKLLPSESIYFRNAPNKFVKGAHLSDLIENLILEIKCGKKKYKDFIILKNKDFNTRKQAGIIVVKCKNYPFVVKLFMETPRSFIRPYNKGFEPACFFIIGGGATRHLLGFTRIKNAESTRKRLISNNHWKTRVDVPRKWFWLPKRYNVLQLDGYNIGGHKHIRQDYPGTYALVADAIDFDKKFSIFNKEHKRTAIDLSNFLLCRIDPHLENFVIEKETGKILMIDTEHFPSMVGFKTRPKINSYGSWYLHLVTKFIKDRFFRTKWERHQLQLNPTPPFSMA
jgi:hypothetical protein